MTSISTFDVADAAPRDREQVATTFRYVAIPTRVAEKVRETLASPGYGHPARVDVATGHGPCRHCLRTFDIGNERRILFTYDPFHGLEPFPLPGPVFVHEEPCERYPEDGGFPEDLRAHPLTLNAYGRGRRVIAQLRIDDGQVEDVLERLFADPAVAYVHVRDTAAGCYDLRVER